MTNNLVTFIKGPLREWVERNSDLQQLPHFWLVPCDKNSPDFLALCKNGDLTFSAYELRDIDSVDNVSFSSLASESTKIFCVSAFDMQSEINHENVQSCGLEIVDLHFLLKAKFLVACDSAAATKIPRQLVEGTVFEEDLLPFLPKVHAFVLQDGVGREPSLVTYTRAFLSLNDANTPGYVFRESLLELALSIPDAEHDWLMYQLLILARSKRYDSFYLELYKFLEFFFPISNIVGLKTAISYPGTSLQLLEKCREQLSWNMNHHSGIRAATKFVGVAFAEVLRGGALTYSEDATEPEREKKGNSWKQDAVDQLAELRHELTHQNFKRNNVDQQKVLLYIKALFVFLIEAFATYRSDVLGEK